MLTIILAIVVGFLVWHATRANQAHLAVKSRRAQIRNLRREIRTFALRGIVVLIVLVLLSIVALRF